MKTTLFTFIALLGLLAGCENEEKLYSDVPRVGIGEAQGSNVDSVEFSFMTIDAAQQADTLYIPLHLMGNSAPVDRPVAVAVVTGESNAPSAAYSIEGIIPAGAFGGHVAVVIQRAAPGIDLMSEYARLALRLVPNEYFELSVRGDVIYTVIWCDFMTEPETWIFINSTVGPFSRARYKFIIDTTGETEFSAYQSGGSYRLYSLQKVLRKALADYNADPANAGRPEGWPYLDDDGTPLVFP